MKDIFERTLIIAPHYDDEVIGCGGLLAKLRNQEGVDVKILVVCSEYTNAHDCDISDIRYAESIRSLEVLGYSEEILIDNYISPASCYAVDGYLGDIPMKALVTYLDRVIKDYKPTAVLFPYSSHHQDHQILNKACIAALRPLVSTNNIRLKAMYEYPYLGTWSDTVLPSSRLYINLSEEELRDKKFALLAYQSQLVRDKRDLLDSSAIVDLARVRGREIGQYAAEAYYPMIISY